MSPTFLRLNRGKRSVVLNLKDPVARKALGQILATADVFLHNMRPDAAAKLGLDYAGVKADNPKIIHVAAFGYGQDGPYAKRPAYDDIIQSAAGIASSQGIVSGVPQFVVSTIVDKTCAWVTLSSVMAALLERERTGEGQSIEIPMFETMVADLLMEHMMGMIYEPPVGKPGNTRTISKYRRPHQTTDGYLGVMLYTDAHWRTFLKAVDREDLIDHEMYTSMTKRNENIDVVYGFLGDLIATRSTQEWVEFFDAIDVPAFPVQSLEELFEDPHLLATGFYEYEEHPTEGTLRQMRPTVRFSNSPLPPIMRVAPHLGEHTREVLVEVGVADDDVDHVSN
jgi:formyl-CoA transferase